jgi:hypothetical protein
MSAQDVYQQELMGGMYGPNPYSQYQGRIPLPGYAGTPTDALGRPIQPPPGTTLNSQPAAPPPAPSSGLNVFPNNPAANAALQRQFAALAAQGMGTQQANAYRGLTGGGLSTGNPTVDAAQTAMAQQAAQGGGWAAAGGAAPAAQAASAAPGSWQQAVSLLSNPGKVTTPGATVPQSQIGNQPSVLQQFLASQHGGTGAGNYSNTGFFDTLNALGRR